MASGSGDFSYAFTASGKSNATGTSYTLASADLGAAGAKHVLIAVSCNASPSTITGVTVDGQSCSAALSNNGTNSSAAFYITDAVTAASGDVVVSTSGTVAIGVAVYALYNCSGTAADTLTSSADPMTGTIDVPAGGAVFVAWAAYNPASVTYTGATEDVDHGALSAGEDHGGAGSQSYAAAQTGLTITVDPNVAVSERAMAAISYGG